METFVQWEFIIQKICTSCDLQKSETLIILKIDFLQFFKRACDQRRFLYGCLLYFNFHNFPVLSDSTFLDLAKV